MKQLKWAAIASLALALSACNGLNLNVPVLTGGLELTSEPIKITGTFDKTTGVLTSYKVFTTQPNINLINTAGAVGANIYAIKVEYKDSANTQMIIPLETTISPFTVAGASCLGATCSTDPKVTKASLGDILTANLTNEMVSRLNDCNWQCQPDVRLRITLTGTNLADKSPFSVTFDNNEVHPKIETVVGGQ